MTSLPQTSVVTRVAGRYELLRELGRGGMGVVHLAYDVELRRLVALKRRCKAGLPHEERFRRESQALAAIEHSGVPRLLHSGRREEGEAFFTMELVRGETLRALLERGPLEPGRALALAIDLGRVLAAVHRVGIVHRDVKPDNIIIEPGDRVRLIDFGACYFTGSYYRQPHLRSVTATGERWGTGEQEFVGTTAYTDPEYLIEGAISPQSDVFSVCVVLYEMLTGRRLHDVATQGFREINAAELPQGLTGLAAELRRGVSVSYRRHPSMDDLVRQLEIVRRRQTSASLARRGRGALLALGAFALGALVTVLLRTGTTPAPEATPVSASIAEKVAPFRQPETKTEGQHMPFPTDMSPRTHAVSAPSPVAPSEPQELQPGPPTLAPNVTRKTSTRTAPPSIDTRIAAAERAARRCLDDAGASPRPLVVTLQGGGLEPHVRGVGAESVHARCIRAALTAARLPADLSARQHTFFSTP